MKIQSIRRTPIPGLRDDSDLRSYRDDWPELRLKIPPALPGMRGVDAKIDVVLADSGEPHGRGADRDDDGHAADLRATVLGRRRRSKNNLTIRALKCFSAQGWPEPDQAAAVIAQLKPTDRTVLVLAWDTGHDTDLLGTTIAALAEVAVVVIAAGNWSLDNDRHPNWPANHGKMPHVLTVMATDEHDERASYSSYGVESVYIAAPGVATLDPPPHPSSPLRMFGSLRDRVREFRGTSAATAHVARLAALVWAKHPDMTPADVKQHIGATAIRERKVRALEKYCATGAIADFAEALK